MKIPATQNHCEIGNDKPGSANLTVGKFMASFAAWSLEPRTKTALSSLSCEGNKCSLSFGNEKDIEGWGRHLRFTLNKDRNGIRPQSLECLDVP